MPSSLTALPQDETKSDLRDLLGALKYHDHGVMALGADGVLRSLDPDLTVISYAKLHGHQIQKLVKELGLGDDKSYEGVDGHDVVDYEQLVHPGKHLFPPGFRELPFYPYPLAGPRATSTDGNIAHHFNTTKAPETARSPLLETRAGQNPKCMPGKMCYTNEACQPLCKRCYISRFAWFGACWGT